MKNKGITIRNKLLSQGATLENKNVVVIMGTFFTRFFLRAPRSLSSIPRQIPHSLKAAMLLVFRVLYSRKFLAQNYVEKVMKLCFLFPCFSTTALIRARTTTLIAAYLHYKDKIPAFSQLLLKDTKEKDQQVKEYR